MSVIFVHNQCIGLVRTQVNNKYLSRVWEHPCTYAVVYTFKNIYKKDIQYYIFIFNKNI